MITAFTGTPGSGKSYDAVRKIIDNLKRGRVVYTNLEGMDEPKQQEFQKTLSGLDDYEYSRAFHFMSDMEAAECWKPGYLPLGCVVVIDEIHKLFNARSWQSENNNGFANFASTHRHHGIEMIWITQSVEKMDKQMRDLIEWCYLYKKNTFMGSAFKNMYLRYSFPDTDTNGKALACEKLFYDSKIFGCYKSYVAANVKELGIMKHTNIFKHPVFFAIPVVLALMVYMVFYKSSLGSGDLFGVKNAQATQQKIIDKIKAQDKPKVVAAVPIYGSNPVTSGAGQDKAVPIVAEASKAISSAVLQEHEDMRIKQLHQNYNPNGRDYWEDENHIRHFLDGHEIQVEYEKN